MIIQTSVFAQGFNWQYSARLPFTYPYLFAGLNGNVNLLYHDTNLNLSEGKGDCCNYKIGRGIGSNFGLDVEYWLNWDLAVNLKLGYSINEGNFVADGAQLPFSVFDSEHRVIGHDTAYFENKMTSRLNYLTFRAGGKLRLFGSHFHVGVSVGVSYLLTSRLIQTERVLMPDYWIYSDGSRERLIADYVLSDISKLYLSPGISFGYDLPLTLGIYATPSISLGFPLMNTAASGKWQTWYLSFGLSVFNSILSK